MVTGEYLGSGVPGEDDFGIVKYWPLGKPIPDGWRFIEGQDMGHHHAHSVLIEQIDAGR